MRIAIVATMFAKVSQWQFDVIFLTSLLVAVLRVSRYEMKYAILTRRTMRLIAPDVAPRSPAWNHKLLLRQKSVLAVTIDCGPLERCPQRVTSRFDT